MDTTEKKLLELGFRKFYHKEFGEKLFWSESDLVKEDESDNWMYNPIDYTKYDLFEHYETLPDEVNAIVQKYGAEDNTMEIEQINLFQKELKALGYEFDYGLDLVPYGLRKIKNNSKKLCQI